MNLDFNKLISKDIIFGSMRMLEYKYSKLHWVQLFLEMYNKGISIHHVSDEYASYNFYCEVLNDYYSLYPQKKIKHIVKLAEPHFHLNIFSIDILHKKLFEYRESLKCENELYAIQWMWRGDLSNDDERCKLFFNSVGLINHTFSSLKNKKLISKFLIFPYTINFAQKVLESEKSLQGFYDGFIVYRNYLEVEFDYILELSGKENIVLRPLNAGKVLNNTNAKDAVNFSLNHKNVYGSIISISSTHRLNEIL